MWLLQNETTIIKITFSLATLILAHRKIQKPAGHAERREKKKNRETYLCGGEMRVPFDATRNLFISHHAITRQQCSPGNSQYQLPFLEITSSAQTPPAME